MISYITKIPGNEQELYDQLDVYLILGHFHDAGTHFKNGSLVI